MKKISGIDIDRKKVAWGITGAGDNIRSILETMYEVNEAFQKKVDIRVFISRSGEKVLRMYRVYDELKESVSAGSNGFIA